MKNNYLFLSDTHLNIATKSQIKKLINHVNTNDPDAILISGDISDGTNLIRDLSFLSKSFPSSKIHFILGNHDYHHSTLDKITTSVLDLCASTNNLNWLTHSDPVPLSQEAALIGAEGWYDGGTGYGPKALHVTLDVLFTKDFRQLIFTKSLEYVFRKLSANYTTSIIRKINSIINNYSHIVLLTHYPPWEQATKDLKRPLHKFWTAYDTNVNLGIALENVMKNYPDKKLTVLCGHTHKEFHGQITENIFCMVGDGTFGSPNQSAKTFYF